MIEVRDTGIVFVNPKPYLCARNAFHPSIASLGGGELLCAFDLGQAAESMDYGTHRARSTNGGLSWTYEGPILRRQEGRRATHSIRIARTSSGLVGFGGLYHRDDPEEGLVNRENLGYVPMELFLLRSQDGGRSWTDPETIRPPLVGPAFEICHAVIELEDGSWLAPTSTWRGWRGDLPNGQKGILLISRDQGRSWPAYGVSFDGDSDGIIPWEQSVIPLGGAGLLSIGWMFHPASGKSLPNRYAVSGDGGRSFGASREIGIRGQTCKGVRLRDDHILLAYRRDDRPGLWASLFVFDERGWRLLAELPLWGARLGGSGMAGVGTAADELSGLKFGFPQMLETESGEVLLVFWCFEDWSTRIRWMRLGITP